MSDLSRHVVDAGGNMENRKKYALVGILSIGFTMWSGRISPLQSMVPPAVVPVKAPRAVRSVVHAKRKARMTEDQCSALAVQATLAKARAEMRALLPTQPADPADIGAAMKSDRRLAEGIKQTFGNSDLIESSYTKRGECVVTLKLSVDRLQKLGRDL